MTKDEEILQLKQLLAIETDKAEGYRKELIAYQANYAGAASCLRMALEQFSKYRVG